MDQPMTEDAARPVPGMRALPVFMVALVGFFGIYALWSFATPLMAAPDEPVHLVKAVAVAHGHLLGVQPDGPGSPFVTVHVPAFYASAGRQPQCFAFHSDIPASCAPGMNGSDNSIPVTIYTGRYPPLYYFLVGLPSLFSTSTATVYEMRLVSALLSAIFLALAVTAVVLWSRSRLLLLGIVIAVTPSAAFFGGVINPSGFEVSAAICLWVCVLLLVLEHVDAPPRGLLALVAVSGSAMALTRGLSPLWVLMLGIAAAALMSWSEIAHLARRRGAQVVAGVLVLAALGCVAWVVHAHTLDVLPSVNLAPPGASYEQVLVVTFQHTGRFFTDMIGTMGWQDAQAPRAVFIGWFMALGLVGATAFALGTRREAAVLLAISIASIVVPVLISASQARRAGYVWQGKDSLPFVVGVPLAAAAILGRHEAFASARARLVGLVSASLGVLSFAAFAETLRRYEVGTKGPLDLFKGHWRPPVPLVGLIALEVVVLAAVAAFLTACVAGADRDPGSAERRMNEPIPPVVTT